MHSERCALLVRVLVVYFCCCACIACCMAACCCAERFKPLLLAVSLLAAASCGWLGLSAAVVEAGWSAEAMWDSD